MAERRRTTLLDFAIAASVAVVPLLLGVLLALDRLAPSAYATRDGERHVSVRQLAALKTFEEAIVRRDRAVASKLDAQALVDAVPACRAEWSGQRGWAARLRALAGMTEDDAHTPAQRIAGHLRALDQALVQLGAPGNRRAVDAVGFDLERWGAAAQRTLASPVEASRYPGRRFDVRCADLASAAAALARGQGRMLAALAWRGSEVERTTRSWRTDQYVAISERHVARANPWSGIPGCVYLWRAFEGEMEPAHFVAASRGAAAQVCATREVFDASSQLKSTSIPTPIAGEPNADSPPDDVRWRVPPSLASLVAPLEPLQRPTAPLYRSLGSGAQNRIALDGAPFALGYSVDLTIDPALQSLAQRVAACYTGRQDVCEALSIRRAEDIARPIGHRHLEQAMVRMAAVAIVDVESGRIEALAGAMTRCTRQEFDGPGRARDCDARLPYPIRYRPDALMNPAVFHDAMPASIVKPVMAAAFLSNRTVGARWLEAERSAMRSRSAPPADSLRHQLMRSDSARFLDRTFCSDQRFGACERIWEVQASSAAFGWNADCARSSEHCGKRDLLFGRAAPLSGDDGDLGSLATWIPFGRLLVEPSRSGGAFHLRAPLVLDVQRVKRCALGADGQRATRDDWEKCSGGVVVDVVAEGWGQGHARASALGAAGMMAALAGAANGQQTFRRPHLVHSVRGVAQPTPAAIGTQIERFALAATEPNTLSAEAANVVLDGLAWGHRSGTSRRACEQVFAAKTCRDIDWIAGKTGTPTFPNDDRTLDEIALLCSMTTKRSRSDEAACGALRPYKWYAGVYRLPGATGWSKAIAVLTERNWIAATGRVHGAGDHGPNPAAEIAFQIAGRQLGALHGDVR